MQLIVSSEVKKLKANDIFKSIFVVKSLTVRQDKNGRNYYDMTVVDSDGSIDAKIWSDAVWLDRSGDNSDITKPAEILSDDDIYSIAGKVVGIDGKVVEYRGQSQYNFNKITLLNQDKFLATDYLPCSPVPKVELKEKFEYILSVCRPEISEFLRKIFNDEMLKNFFSWPAAISNHHAYANGLAEHSLSVALIAKSAAETFNNACYKVDVDVVIAGAILHDIGKLRSYQMIIIPEITIEGAVIDHVVLGYEMFSKLCEKYPLVETLKLQLAHIILSHHGTREYGSPIVPETPEAMIVSSADELDFKMFCWRNSTESMKEDEKISPWNNTVQRRFWNR